MKFLTSWMFAYITVMFYTNLTFYIYFVMKQSVSDCSSKPKALIAYWLLSCYIFNWSKDLSVMLLAPIGKWASSKIKAILIRLFFSIKPATSLWFISFKILHLRSTKCQYCNSRRITLVPANKEDRLTTNWRRGPPLDPLAVASDIRDWRVINKKVDILRAGRNSTRWSWCERPWACQIMRVWAKIKWLGDGEGHDHASPVPSLSLR